MSTIPFQTIDWDSIEKTEPIGTIEQRIGKQYN